MYKGKTIVGIIPARSGSKGLQHKNIRPFAGKPLMAWTILAALDSGILDEVFVSTDSEHYASIAMSYGANAPFLRPKELSGDACPASDYILHTLNEYKERLGRSFDYFVLLQPTSPLRTSEHISEGVRLAIDGNLDSVVSFSPHDEDQRLIFTLPDDFNLDIPDSPNDALRQGTQRLYRVNGMIYVGRCENYIASKTFYGPHGKAMLVDSKYAIDIDDEESFLFAEYLAKGSGRFGNAVADRRLTG